MHKCLESARYADRSSRVHQRAEADFNQAIALNPDEAEAYINRGILHYILKDSQSAIADLRTAAQLFMTK